MSTVPKRNVTGKEKKFTKKTMCNKNTNAKMKRVRIIYDDPDATDSSGDDESKDQTKQFTERVKRVAREVYIPMHGPAEGSEMSVGVEVTNPALPSFKNEGKLEGTRPESNKIKPLLPNFKNEEKQIEGTRPDSNRINPSLPNFKNEEKQIEGTRPESKETGDNVTSGESQLQGYCKVSEPLHDLGEPEPGKRQHDDVFNLPINLDEFVISDEEEMWKQFEAYSLVMKPLVKPMDFSFGKEEMEWFNSL
ncbi:uncharacterized protein LOC141672659 isoform X4 [Apium graveolens]|uniref:uncharacterized protein LOC141672659 isoform X4 n=1 Tax=Apium graveolens TaxID=4045 RepID=UPI003D7A1B03